MVIWNKETEPNFSDSKLKLFGNLPKKNQNIEFLSGQTARVSDTNKGNIVCQTRRTINQGGRSTIATTTLPTHIQGYSLLYSCESIIGKSG